MNPNTFLLTTVLTLAGGSIFLNATPVISEFMAANDTVLADEDGDFSDWIEIHNPDGSEVDLDGYFVTDKASNLDKWRIPAVTIPAGGYLVIFASDKDRSNPEAELHASFKLPLKSGYLALVAPDAVTVLTDFGSTYPLQFEDASNGTIKEFSYNDKSPWPVAADTLGYSITLRAPGQNLDPSEPTHWRASVTPGGTPGSSDGTLLAGNPTDDLDGDGLTALLEHALGTSDNDATQSGSASASRMLIDGILYDSFTYTVKEVADDVRTLVETTIDLQNWSNDPAELVELVVTSNGDGTVTRTVRLATPAVVDSRR
ncbi:lamin tail domain-containing protein, partial [bacterium]|nr:lamin tail domain-containing protein [bacterium]